MSEPQIRLSSWLSSGMVFQHGVTLILSGHSMPDSLIRLDVTKEPVDGRKVSKLDTEYGLVYTRQIRSESDGRFCFELPAQKPSVDSFSLSFTAGEEVVSFSDLRCGDVWVVSGSYPLSVPVSKTRAPKVPLKESALTLLRFFFAEAEGTEAEETRKSVCVKSIAGRGRWVTAKNSAALAGMSAAGFSMAYHLCNQLRYPVGIVDLSGEEESILGWIDTELLKNDAVLDFFAENPQEQGIRNRSLYENFRQFKGLNIRGIVYSPSMKDIPFVEIYRKLLDLFLESAAAVLGPQRVATKANVPSLILLQLQMDYRKLEDNQSILRFNEVLSAARKSMGVQTGVLGQHDLLLPGKTNYFHIGRRLSYIALGQHFTPKMPSSCPECVDVEIVGNKVLLTFDNVGDGLKLSEGELILRGFCICGEDRIYRFAQSKILHGVRVMVWHDDIPNPTGVTYGYFPWPHFVNLKCKSDLPVLPFRFDRESAHYAPDIHFAHFDTLEMVAVEKEGAEPELLPVYEARKGSVVFTLENLNKTEGAASVKLVYKTDDDEFSFAPVLRYASMYAPLDLSPFSSIVIDVFNPEERVKELSISGFEGTGTINIGLRWQQITLKASEKLVIEDMEISIKDMRAAGELYIDNLRFLI